MGDRRQASGNRTRELRARLAQEAARVMAEQGVRDYHVAKLKAAERLGIRDDKSLPRNSEIEQALREYQRLFRFDTQPQLLRERRRIAVEAMKFFFRFEPRLVGAVLEGTADAHSAVTLHLFSDDPDAVPRYLQEQRIPYEEQNRKLRTDRETWIEYPVFVFSADDVAIDLTVLPLDALRQAPLDRIAEKPMKRASLGAVEALLDAETT
jgi:hypothetical protein